MGTQNRMIIARSSKLEILVRSLPNRVISEVILRSQMGDQKEVNRRAKQDNRRPELEARIGGQNGGKKGGGK